MNFSSSIMNDLPLSFNSPLVMIITVLTIMFLCFIYWYQKPSRFPPGPRGIPLLGYIPVFKNPHEEAYRLSKKYGPIISIRIGLEDTVFLNDFTSINQALMKQGAMFSGRPRFESTHPVKKGLGIITADYGEALKSQRKFGLMTLRGFGVGKKGMENICVEESFYLNEEIRSHSGKAFDMSVLLHKTVANVICNVLFGNRFDYNDKLFVKILNLIMAHFGDPLISFSAKMVTFFPKFQYIPPISWGINNMHKLLKELLGCFDEIVEEHKISFDENNIRDFIDSFILEERKEKDASFTNFQLVNCIHDLLLAGTDTSATTLCWALLCFLHYPESQEKMRKEVLGTIGSSGKISMRDRSDMHYTYAFIEEVYRFRTLAPIGVTRTATEDTELGSYLIPKGTKIHPNLWAVHNDPNLWKDPQKFMPERFLNEQGDFVKSKYAMPFSIGPRHCLGEQLARMEIFTFLVGMVQKFEFHPDPNDSELPSIDNGAFGFVYIPPPYKIVAKEF